MLNILGDRAHCGIPILYWCNIYMFLLVLRSVFGYAKLFVSRFYNSYANVFSFASFFTIDGALLVWLIYGNKLYFSSENDCGIVEGTELLNTIMFLILVLGYL